MLLARFLQNRDGGVAPFLALALIPLMGFTGAGFASVSGFWLLFFIAFVGTLNPSSGDVIVFLPTEQSIPAGDESTNPEPLPACARDRFAVPGAPTLMLTTAGATRSTA